MMAYRNKWNAQTQEEAIGDVSKFNAAQLINIRIQGSWNTCRSLWKQGRFDELRDELNSLWTEFYADAMKDQVETIQTLDKEIVESLNQRNKNIRSPARWSHFNTNYKKAIFTKWLFLKQVEKKQGVGKAYVDKEADDWD